MNQNEEEVLLLQYDLTDGKATKFYKFMTGKDLEAIWHTSLVVYGREYYFGGGICKGMPRATPYGYPIKESVFGKTTKTKKEFEDYAEWVVSAPMEIQKKALAEDPVLRKEWDEKYGDRMIKIVFIGQKMDKAKITAELDACLTE